MTVPFEISPYETLGITAAASPDDIRKAYRKQCLKYHPDKLNASKLSVEEQKEYKTAFEKVQFAHLVLSDEKRRKRYDTTGSLEETSAESDDFDWFEYFKSVKAEINEESILKDKLVYQGSEDEETDIIESWTESGGDFLQLFETIPHSEVTTEDEVRLFDKVEELIKAGAIDESASFVKYKKNRKTQFGKVQKKAAREAKAAAKAKAELSIEAESTAELAALIQRKRKNDMDSLIARLEDKYTKKKPSKKAKR
jgi:DnaJ family protein C protein 9